MADILDAAQSNTQPPSGTTPPSDVTAPPVPPVVEPVPEVPMEPAPVPPPPAGGPPVTSFEPATTPEPIAPSSDSLIIPPPETPAPEPTISSAPPVLPPTEKPKKKSRLGVLLAGLLLLVITLPILVVFVKQQVEIRSRASGTCTAGRLNTAGTCPDGKTIIYVMRKADCTTYNTTCPGTTTCTPVILNTAGTCPDGKTIKYVRRNADCSTTTDTCPGTPPPPPVTTTAPTTPNPPPGCKTNGVIVSDAASCCTGYASYQGSSLTCGPAPTTCDSTRNQYASLITSCMTVPTCTTGVWTCPAGVAGKSCTTSGGWKGTCKTAAICNATWVAGIAYEVDLEECPASAYGCCGIKPATTPICPGLFQTCDPSTGGCCSGLICQTVPGDMAGIGQCAASTTTTPSCKANGLIVSDANSCCSKYAAYQGSSLTCGPAPSTTTIPSCKANGLIVSDANSCCSKYAAYQGSSLTCGPAPSTTAPGSGTYAKCCPKYNTATSINTCTGNASQITENSCAVVNASQCKRWDSTSCPPLLAGGTPPPGTNTGVGTGNWACGGGTGAVPAIGTTCTNGGTYNGKCIVFHCPNGCTSNGKCGEDAPDVWWEYQNCSSASLAANECGQIDTVTDSNRYCQVSAGCDVKQLVCGGGCSGGPAMPTTPLQCINIVAYKDGNALSASDLSALHVGDTITLAFAPGGAATKVRFRVNSTSDADWNETTTKNANSQFTWNYTLANTTSFNIEAQWFDGSVWH